MIVIVLHRATKNNIFTTILRTTNYVHISGDIENVRNKVSEHDQKSVDF